MSVFSNPANSTPEQTRAYTTAVFELLGTQEPLDVLRATESKLRAAIAGVAPERLARPEAPGKWSVQHVLAHLADSDVVWGWRIRLILAQDRPTIQGYDQDAWSDALGWGETDPQQSLESFGTLRRWNLQLLERVTPAELERVGVHAERGEESIAHLMKLYAGHDLLHLNQIQRILDAQT